MENALRSLTDINFAIALIKCSVFFNHYKYHVFKKL